MYFNASRLELAVSARFVINYINKHAVEEFVMRILRMNNIII